MNPQLSTNSSAFFICFKLAFVSKCAPYTERLIKSVFFTVRSQLLHIPVKGCTILKTTDSAIPWFSAIHIESDVTMSRSHHGYNQWVATLSLSVKCCNFNIELECHEKKNTKTSKMWRSWVTCLHIVKSCCVKIVVAHVAMSILKRYIVQPYALCTVAS